MQSNRTGLAALMQEANRVGRTLNLDDVYYGPSSWGTKQFIERPSPYYYFLAGWCAVTKSSSAIEVGTHYAGSTFAILRGLVGNAKIVTMDVTDLNAERLAEEPRITKLIGSGADAAVQDDAVKALGRASCDLLYIDALKDKKFVFDVLDGFKERLPVRYAILDDISIVPPMREMWKEVEARYGDRCLDVSKLDPSIRAENVGFGVIDLI